MANPGPLTCSFHYGDVKTPRGHESLGGTTKIQIE